MIRIIALLAVVSIGGPAAAGPPSGLPEPMATISEPKAFPAEIALGEETVVQIKYAKNLDKERFLVRLNGKDITDALIREPDSSELIPLSLVPGNNRLELEVLPEKEPVEQVTGRIDRYTIHYGRLSPDSIGVQLGPTEADMRSLPSHLLPEPNDK